MGLGRLRRRGGRAESDEHVGEETPWTTSGDRTPWRKKGGKGTKPIGVHFQLRPDPLAR